MPVDADETERARPATARRADVLATIPFGNDSLEARMLPSLAARIPNRPLAPCPAEEVWPAVGAVSRIVVAGAPAAADDRSVFVAIEAQDVPGAGIDALTNDLYRRLLTGIECSGYPHLLRMWNYVPRIHESAAGLDRYMHFCKGRSEGFAAHYGAAFSQRLPAASAVGCPGERLIVHALASREPGRHVENPRQVAAHSYPDRYGPKSPSFARGTVAGAAWNGTVFVSGTASIVGHESVFRGDPERQSIEAMRNVEAVLDAAGVPGRGGPIGARLRSLRVYVRFPDQIDAIRGAILESAQTAVPTACLQAEICRKELLVEIEAIALPREG
jgi:chorismate lyase/3-hydroxybenzoate synthase